MALIVDFSRQDLGECQISGCTNQATVRIDCTEQIIDVPLDGCTSDGHDWDLQGFVQDAIAALEYVEEAGYAVIV